MTLTRVTKIIMTLPRGNSEYHQETRFSSYFRILQSFVHLVMHSPDNVSYLNGTHLALSAHRIAACYMTADGVSHTDTNNGMLDMGSNFVLASEHNNSTNQQFHTSITVPETTLCLTSGSFTVTSVE